MSYANDSIEAAKERGNNVIVASHRIGVHFVYTYDHDVVTTLRYEGDECIEDHGVW